MKNIRMPGKEYVLAPVAILAISTASIFIRFSQASLSSLAIATYRLVFASLIMLPFSIVSTYKSLRNKEMRDPYLLLLSGMLLSLHFVSWIISLEFTSVINSVVLVTTTPIWVALFSPLITKEKPKSKFWFGLIIAMVGIILVSGIFRRGTNSVFPIDQRDRFIGNGLALIGAICAAFYVIIGRFVRNDVSNRVYTFSVYSVAAITLLIITILIPSETLMVSVADLKWLILLAIIPQLIGHSLINLFLGTLPAHEVSIFLLGEPIGSTILAIFFLEEIPGLMDIMGGFIILAGIGIAVLNNRQEE